MTDQDACDFILAKVKANSDAEGSLLQYHSLTHSHPLTI
jgi:hypothetical protein